MNTIPSPSLSVRSRALVLGGGGAAGNAWLIGVLAGLQEAGLDPTDAGLVVGTSAGTTAAAQLGGAALGDLLHDVLTTPMPGQQRPPGPPQGAQAAGLQRVLDISAASIDAHDMRRRMGASAIALAEADPSQQSRWRSTVAARLPRQDWPELELRLTVVDAETGESLEFDRSSGVELVDAVAASTAGGPAYRIGERWYIDGGYRRSSENADLAAGYERVLVLSPLGGRTLHRPEWRLGLPAQIEDLEASGSRVETILPDEAALAAFGGNMMDVSTRPAAARAGHQQGKARAEALIGFW